LGGLVVNLMGLAFGIVITLLLLAKQIGVRRERDELVVFRWLPYLRGMPPDHSIPISAVRTVRVAWPLKAVVESENEAVVLGTFWWRPRQYRDFEVLLDEAGVAVTYEREYPGRRK
jgi:hypothetical protein